MFQYDKIMIDKVKEAQTNKEVVFSKMPEKTPKHHYLKGCISEADLVLPLLDKVRGKTLCLQSYALSKGHCRALASACRLFDDHLINRILFDNCGIDDLELSIIIEACLILKDFKSIVYK